MGLLVCLEDLEVLAPKVYLDPLVWMDLMDLMGLKASLEPQVQVGEVTQVLLVFQDKREREASHIQEVQASLVEKEREEIQVLLDSQGSPDGRDLLVRLWGQIYLDHWESLVFLDWMESMVSKVLQVLLGHLALAQPRETEVMPGSQASLAPPAGKENLDSQEARVFLAVLVLKGNVVRLASVEVLASRVSLVTLVTMEAKDPRDSEVLRGVRVPLESRCQ